jgi:uncharacterized protein DUF4190
MYPQSPGSDPTRSDPQQPIYVDPVTGQQLFVDPVTGQLRYGSDTRPLPAPPPPPVAYSPVYQPAPWSYGYSTNYYAPARTDGRATASLVLSIIGLVTFGCWGVGALLGLVGAIFGHAARRGIRETGAGGHGLATAGIVCGWIAFAVGLATLTFTLWIVSNVSAGGF